jgi:hypothetical protein
MADATARGVYSINTTTWAAKVLEPRAASAVLAGDGVIAFGGTLEGIVGIVPDGRPWTLSSANGLAGDVDSVHIITDTAFVVTHDVLGRCRVTTVDAASGRIRRTAQSEHQLVDIVGTAPSR